jgi:dienelactone hydrolase
MCRSSVVLLLALAACQDKGARSPSTPSPPVPAATTADVPSSRRLEVTFMSGPLKLFGFLWLPRGDGPHRAVVFNHGSEPDPSDAAPLARFYNEHGFVFFVPVRRGHGKSEGKYILRMRDEAGPGGAGQKVTVDELVAQVDDVLAGLAYLSSRSDVRTDAVAVTGCSFGGIEVIFTAERPSGFKAAVDFAGGAMSWSRSALLRDRMLAAASRATMPILFVQAENDFDTEPSVALSAEMDRQKKPNERRLYPPRGSTPREGHGLCREPTVWGADVVAWLDRTMPP